MLLLSVVVVEFMHEALQTIAITHDVVLLDQVQRPLHNKWERGHPRNHVRWRRVDS